MNIPDPPLTRREIEILRRAAFGHNDARIAADLGVSRGTVRNHLAAVYAKLDVRTRTEAVVWAWRRRLLHPDDPEPSG